MPGMHSGTITTALKEYLTKKAQKGRLLKHREARSFGLESSCTSPSLKVRMLTCDACAAYSQVTWTPDRSGHTLTQSKPMTSSARYIFADRLLS